MNTETEGKTNRSVSYSIDLSAPTGDPFNSVVVSPPVVERTPEPVVVTPEPTIDPGIEPVAPVEEPSLEDNNQPAAELGEGDVNPYYYLAEALKSEKYLPDTIEINEKIDGTTVYSGFKQKLREDLEPQVRQEVYQALEAEGVSAPDLLIARAIRQGVDHRLLSEGSMFERNASLPDDSPDDQKIALIKQMYQHRNFKDDEIKRQITSAEADDNIDNLFSEGKQYFAERYGEFVEKENQRYTQLRQQEDERVRRGNEVLKKIFSTGEILDEKLSKDQIKVFEDAIRKEDQIVEVNGGKYRASEMQKFLVEFDQSAEMKFLLFKLYKFRNQDKDQMKVEAIKEVENDFLKGYETKVLSSKKATKNQEVKQSLETTKATARSYFVDLSPQK